MNVSKDSVLSNALHLEEHDRLEIADRLYDSVYGPRDAAIDEAWAAEIERRLAELDAGRATLIPWEQVRSELLGKGRARAAG